MVHFIAKYNPPLKNWLESHPGNVSWLSHDMQNELLHLLADEVAERLLLDCWNCAEYDVRRSV